MSADLERRIARLEAIEAVRYAFHRYFHAIDNNNIDLLINEVFTKDAVLVISNYPPGSGQNLLLDTEEKIRAVYGPIKADGHRHNAANTSVWVNDDVTEAKVTASSSRRLRGATRAACTRAPSFQWVMARGRPSAGWCRASGAGASPTPISSCRHRTSTSHRRSEPKWAAT
ncbi:MAG: nuclear transport factor 2 family protein, partial [Actinomycetota bacterium]